MPCSWIDIMANKLSEFIGIEVCPDCGCLTNNSGLRCPECGLFHYDLDALPDRDAPPPVVQTVIEKPDVDPLLYSLNPGAALPEAVEDDAPDVTVNWSESNSDFTFTDDEQSVSNGVSEDG